MISILPSRDDRVVASGSEVAGAGGDSGAARRHVVERVPSAHPDDRHGRGGGLPSKYYCLINGWGEGKYTHLCYSDIPPLYSLAGTGRRRDPLHQRPPADQVLEYPALTGVFVYLAARLTPAGNTDWFFDVNVILLLICWLVAVIATALAQRSRPWDAAMVALAPASSWRARSTGTCCRWHSSPCPSHCGPTTGRPGPGCSWGSASRRSSTRCCCWGRCSCCAGGPAHGVRSAVPGGAIVAWLAVNVPFMLAKFRRMVPLLHVQPGTRRDFGSIWLALTTAGRQVPADQLNTVATGLLLLASVGIALLVWRGPQAPAWRRSRSWSWPPSC